MLKLGTPLSAAFMPLVPLASRGNCGVLSQRSTPAVIFPPTSMLVVEKDGVNGFLECFFRFENFPDEFLAAAVVRVRFAGVNDLEFSRVLGDFAEAVEIGKNQVRPFIASSTACEADGEDVGIELEAGFAANGLR